MGKKDIYYCVGCGKKHSKNNFYKSYNSNHKNGAYPFCKKYIKEKVYKSNNKIDVKKFQGILREIDAPFIKSEFDGAILEKRETIGAYFSRISMKQYREYTWKDSGLDESTSQKKSNLQEDGKRDESKKTGKAAYSSEWRGEYTELDLEYLNDYYKELQRDFKIITKNHKDYAKKIAKASLAMDNAYEDMMNNVSGSVKRYKDLKEVFDSLSKSAQFAEDKRGKNDVSLGGFGVVFDKVEQKKWIPKHTPLEKDEYDKLIEYFSTINKSI